MTPEEQLEKIKRGTVEIIQENELLEKLHWSYKEKKPLFVKAGFDPTAPDLHLGHTVLLRKLRHFQKCGHKVIFLIGDATAVIGDPSGKSETRPILKPEQIKENAATYVKQVSKILDVTNTNLFEVCYNSEWFWPNSNFPQASWNQFNFFHLMELLSHYSVARLIERDDFTKRLGTNQELNMLEFFYPLMQGYDSVRIQSKYGSCDVELGGTDQKFNLLVGRNLQRSYQMPPQVQINVKGLVQTLPPFGLKQPQTVITMPLLEGLDGVQKMSKSLGNHIGINESPSDMFGKIMSISDEMMWKYFELLTDVHITSVKNLHPRDAKKFLAREIVKEYHDMEAAKTAEEKFEQGVGKQERKNVEKIIITEKYLNATKDYYNIPVLLVGSGLTLSTSEARRKIDENAVKLNGEPISNFSINYQIPKDKVKNGAILSLGWKAIAIEIPETGGTHNPQL